MKQNILILLFLLLGVTWLNAQVTVDFSVDMNVYQALQFFDPATDQVFLMGSFNGWQQNDLLSDPNSDGIYNITIPLDENTNYEYKYFVTSSNAPNSGWEGMVGGGDNGNRILQTTTGGQVLPTDYFDNLDKPIKLLTPNGGEIWKVGLNYDIKWLGSEIDNIDIEYSTDNGNNWNPIASNYPTSSGKYTWAMPNTISSQCKVKITKVGNGISDESDGLFEIKAAGVTTEVETNNTANEAMNVGVVDDIYGSISPDNDVDYYKFTASEGDIVEIFGVERNGSGLNGLIILFDQNGNQLWSNQNFNNDPQRQRIVYELPTSGVYYVRYTNNNNWGNYPNSAVKSKETDDEISRMTKQDGEAKKENAPMALSGEYRLTIGYFTSSAPIANNAYWNAATYNSVMFGGDLYPNDLPTTVTFEYGLTTGYGSTIQPNPAVYEGLNEVGVNQVKVTGLQASTEYHFRMNVQNSAGVDYSDDQMFTTPGEPEGWVFQESGLSDENISIEGIYYTDENTGYAATYYNGVILKTTDGGTNWSNQVVSNGQGFRDIRFATSSIGVAVGTQGTIARTTDGGTTWSSQSNIITSEGLTGISFGNASTGYAVGYNGTILKTTDAGATWTLLGNSPTTEVLRGVHFTDENKGTIVAYNGVIVTTTDGGSNWAIQTLPSGRNLYGVHYVDGNNGWVVGDGDEAYHTTDGGVTWNPQNLGNWYNLNGGVHFTDFNNGTAVGSGGVILRTTNGGNSWTREETGTTVGLRDIHYNVKGTIVGDYATILRSVDYLSLESPNGGEIWKVGLNYDIKWNGSGVDNIDIEFSTDNGSNWNPIVSNYPTSSGKYSWTIPNNISAQCKVKISKTGNGVSDQSNAVFEIKVNGVTTEVETNNTANEAMNVGIIDEIEGTINPESDIDYFKFTGSAGDLVEIYGEERNASGLEGLIMLFDQNGNQLSSDSYFENTPTKQRIVYQLPNSGIYYVRYSNQNNWGGYPNLAAKSNETDSKMGRMPKPNQATQKVNAPLAYSGDYRLTIKYFEPSAPIFNYCYITDHNYNSIRFFGSIYPNGLETSITIEWGETIAYGNTVLITSDANSLDEYNFTSDKVPGLSPSTPYYYKVTLQNSLGTFTSGDLNFSTPNAPENWVHQNSGSSDWLTSIDFIDANNGFVLGSGMGNTILKTSDGGTTWTNVCPLNQNPQLFGYGVEVLSANKIVAVGSYGLILISEDGGNSWSQQQVGNYWHKSVSFSDVNNGVVVNENGEIYKTTNGGNNWSQLTDPITSVLIAVTMLNANTIIAISGDGWIIKSVDGGLNWTTQQLGSWSNSWKGGISFVNMNDGMIAPINTDLIYKTTDGGTTWSQLTPNIGGNFSTVSMIDANNTIIAGSSLLRTQNGAATWTQENTGTYNWLYGIKTLPSGEAWAVGDWGTILRYVPTQHFSPVWTGNPNQAMNIFVTSAKLDGVDLDAEDEIGVFDGANCVGFVKLTGAIPSGSYVQIIASTDDPTTPEVDGFIAGHTITYKLWDSNNSSEITRVTSTYALGDGTFSSLGSASVSLNGVFTITQDVDLTTGWNIYSLAANPDDPNMLQLLNPLISGGVLIKTQNEQGNSVEQLPVIGWINNIGNWLATEGYYIKVNASSTLSVTGPPVTLPINIPLTNGWNIMGYPVQAEQNALTVLEPLITANQLIKVQDETGNSVEQLPIIGWINNIGNFRMDEGYYLKVNTNTSITLDEPVAPITTIANNKEKGTQKTNVINKPTANHFTPVWSNNPLFAMNFFVYSASLSGGGNLGAGDEIGVFDGANCVGAVVLSGPISGYVQIIASADDQGTPAIDGYTAGHTISYKFWLSSTSTEISDYTVSYVLGSGTFVLQGTVAMNFTNILPVELTSFTANVKDNIVNLNWQTATEVNNYGFEMERKQGEKNEWTKIGFVEGNGNSNSPKEYSFIDKNPIGGSKFQYRLKQIDVDGKYEYSNVIEVEVSPTVFELYQNYPNPFNPVTNIKFALPVAGNVKIRIYNLLGEEVMKLLDNEYEAGFYKIELNAADLSSGIYIYRLETANFVDSKKFVLLK